MKCDFYIIWNFTNFNKSQISLSLNTFRNHRSKETKNKNKIKTFLLFFLLVGFGFCFNLIMIIVHLLISTIFSLIYEADGSFDCADDLSCVWAKV